MVMQLQPAPPCDDDDALVQRRARASLCPAEGLPPAKQQEQVGAMPGPGPGRERESLVLDQALVRQILPPRVCLPLRHGRPVPPEAFSGVGIFFSDVVGFTTISAGVEPIKVVQLLNSLFTVMDYCCSLFPLYKVETIGDAYMVAGGLPERDEDNAQHLADFSLLVQQAVAAAVVSPLDGAPVQIRMGCHTGDVMAGVVGTMMPRYCLFGDTVNTASRMESNGEPGRVHVSDTFASKVRAAGTHALQGRGRIKVKGKGEMETFWLLHALPVGRFLGVQSAESVVAHCKELARNCAFE